MKSRIKKIIISAAALIFVTSGVSLAHDSDKRIYKRHGKAHGHYKAKKHHSDRGNKHFKAWKHNRKHQRRHDRKHHLAGWKHHLAGYYCEDGFYHYYDKRDHRWENNHLKSRRHHRDRYVHKNSRRDNDTYYRRHAPREDVVYKLALKDPKIVFKVLQRDHR